MNLRRLAVRLRLIHPEDELRHREARRVLAQARREIRKSQAARAVLQIRSVQAAGRGED